MKPERYSILCNRRLVIPSATTDYISMSRRVLIEVMRGWIGRIRFDPEWYVTAHPDIAEALRSGVLDDAHEHYLKHGYFEGRMPYYIQVDEAWYLKEYSDVRKAIEAGAYPSAQEHFVQAGYRDGRLPYDGFELGLGADDLAEPLAVPAAKTVDTSVKPRTASQKRKAAY